MKHIILDRSVGSVFFHGILLGFDRRRHLESVLVADEVPLRVRLKPLETASNSVLGRASQLSLAFRQAFRRGRSSQASPDHKNSPLPSRRTVRIASLIRLRRVKLKAKTFTRWCLVPHSAARTLRTPSSSCRAHQSCEGEWCHGASPGWSYLPRVPILSPHPSWS